MLKRFAYLLPVFCFCQIAAAQTPRVAASYNPEFLEAIFHFDKKEYLIGEPIYWEIEFKAKRLTELRFQPSYEHGVHLDVILPGGQPIKYRGTDLSGMVPFDSHYILTGDSRYFHFRVFYDNNPVTPHPSRLMFYEPTKAYLKPKIRYIIDQSNQIYDPGQVFEVSIVAPTGRNAECLRLLQGEDLIPLIHDMKVSPDKFELVENILHLYSDTVYAPHLAIALANGYYWDAMETHPPNEQKMRRAIAAYTVLLQVEDIPYIQELSLFMITAAYFHLKKQEPFVAWYQKYLDNYGERARFAFQGHKFMRKFLEWREDSQGPFWYLFP
jgi:hypothetical protein